MTNDTILQSFVNENLQVNVYANRKAMGERAAEDVANRMKELLQQKDHIRMVFAAAPSQNEFLQALVQTSGLDWSRVTAFHMDEYIGLPHGAEQKFSHFLNQRLFQLVNPGHVHLIDGSNEIEAECERYTRLLTEAPIDIVCLGIGENGHIAFNDPPVADFEDPKKMKSVELDEACRTQQVNDGCFPDIASVPLYALTLTIPAMMSGSYLYCMVPGPTKRNAVSQTLRGEISTACPASILRTHHNCTLYLDTDSYEGGSE
ncbi:glucosamine-6-phosphate deaminase [Paenibacillus sp. strain BS8-2]